MAIIHLLCGGLELTTLEAAEEVQAGCFVVVSVVKMNYSNSSLIIAHISCLSMQYW